MSVALEKTQSRNAARFNFATAKLATSLRTIGRELPLET